MGFEYNESKGYQELPKDEKYGEGAEQINEARKAAVEGKDQTTLADLYHMESQLEIQLQKAFEPDKEVVQERLDSVRAQIKALESPESGAGH